MCAVPLQIKSATSRRSKKPADEGLLRELGRKTASGLSAVGNALDLPGSMVRDALAGENPFDQWATPLTGENRVGGRELMERAGFLGPNKKGFDFGDVAGFVGEVALDPLSYVSGIGLAKGLSRGGHALSKASPAIKNLSRVERMTTTVGKAAASLPGDIVEHAAKHSGFASAADLVAREGHKPVGGLVGVGLPFKAPSFAIGTGATAQKVGAALDNLGKAARYSAVGRHWAALFSRANRGALSRTGQELAHTATEAEHAAGVGAREAFAPHLEEFAKFADTLPDAASRLQAHDAFRGAVEDVAPLPQHMAHLQPAVDAVRQANVDVLAREQAEGLTTQHVDDIFADYQRRMRFFFPGDKSKHDFPSLLLSGKHGSQKQRQEILRDLQGGTPLINKLTLDPQLSGVAHGMKPADMTKQFWNQQEQLVNQAMQAAGVPNQMYEHSRQLAKWLADLDPRHVTENIPVFPHNPVEEAARRVEIGDRAIGMAKAIRESIQQPGNNFDFMQAPPGSVPVKDALERAGLDAPATLQLMGLPADAHMPKELAEDIGRVVKSFQRPDEVNAVLKAVDKFTALFKTGVTSLAPAFHVRNRTSGAVQNWMIGAFSLRSERDADRLIRARGAISGLQELGGKYAGLSDDAATKQFAHEVFAQKIAPRGQGIGLSELSGTTLDRNMASDIPGVNPVKFRKIASDARPRNLRELNPMNIAGVATETDVNSLAKAGREAGGYIEAQNRISGYLELRRKGFSPGQAAERINAAHVDYNSLSAAEREVLRRTFPFYSFQKGMSEFVAKELLDRPGGKMGQTIRAANQHDQEGPVPDDVASSLSIPMGQLSDGSQRYLTGTGLMHEAVFDPLHVKNGLPDVGATVAEIGGKLNPLLKAGIESGTNYSLFQQRPLDTLDPAIGRTLSNLGLRDTFPSGRARPVIGPQFENAVMNTPISRLISTARTATDKRKREATGGLLDAVPGQVLAMQLLTGLRVSDVPVWKQEAILRDALVEIAKEEGAQTFADTRFTKSAIAEAEKRGDKALAARMRLLNSAQTDLVNRAKARKAKITPPAR